MKACTKCGQEKEFSEFHKSNYQKSGYSCHCKNCDREKRLKYAADHVEELREKSRKYNLENREKLANKLRRWRDANREKTNAYPRNRRAEDPVYKRCQQMKHRLYLAFTDTKHPHRPLMKYLDLPSAEAFRSYLIYTFVARYSRLPVKEDNAEIDHIIPLCTAKTLEDVDVLNKLNNLQLLTRYDNAKKGTKHDQT